MSNDRSEGYLAGLVRELCKVPTETEWVEFKANYADPKEIGEYVSALANSAALAGKAFAYVVWGISDVGHEAVGTSFEPAVARVGNEELENWLLRLLEPKIQFRFFRVTVEGRRLVLLEIGRAFRHPVRFEGTEYVRIGSYKKKLKDFPEKERELWRIFDRTPFEEGVALERTSSEDVLRLLDYPAYFDLLKRPLPENRAEILRALADDSLIRKCEAGGWDITNLGAVLFAKRLDDFHSQRRKAVRVVQYSGNSRITTQKEHVEIRGYAGAFESLIQYIDGLVPAYEVVEQGRRRAVSMFPELAVRELVANALIHQDFFISGAGPMVEIFGDRLEITNPGAPLVDALRFVDSPPRSRNEALASLMRRIGICEERGSGWDKVVFQTELHQLPAPLAEATKDDTRVVMFAPRALSKMERDDRIRAVYLHACLRYVNREHLTNRSLRERFGIEPQNIAIASRMIREAVDAGFIAPDDPDAAPKMMRYVPAWAVVGAGRA